MKSKKLFMMLLIVCGMVFASESNFVQFTLDDFNTYDSTGGPIQDWVPAQMITLNIAAGSTVYLTNYVSQFKVSLYDPGAIPNLGDSNYAAGYDMSAGAYGYMVAKRGEDGKVTTDGTIHWGTGEKKDITYYDPNSTYSEEQIAQGLGTQTTTGYKLGTFDEDTEIFFVMTPNGYDKKINSYLPVNDPDNNPPVTSILASRQINTVDLAGNIRVNFGTVDGVAHEFVIGSEATPSTPSGQPLPGVLTSCLVALGATGIAARRRKHSKK